ncbi:ost3 ost6 family protein [Cystoisospora suis]|uniref:Ost3 ost6 family protein n=1 Tax=Cystoisospora suis TaxID=483139 RepID=A0A2C6LGQ5_9APIC|nr:ost3 ost6 family protein [Cystoisospora suis]
MADIAPHQTPPVHGQRNAGVLFSRLHLLRARTLAYPGLLLPLLMCLSLTLYFSPVIRASAASSPSFLASLARFDELRLRASDSNFFLVDLDESTYSSLLLHSLPPARPPKRVGNKVLRGPSLLKRKGPNRFYHLFVLYTLLDISADRQLRCNECQDALEGFQKVSTAYHHAGAFNLPKGQRDEKAHPIPPSSAPVLFAVVNVATLNQTPALHALPSLPAVVHIPPSSPADLTVEDEEDDEEEEEAQEINLEDQWARMVANAPLPFPRQAVLVLQRAINDAGVGRSMLQWTNMKTGRDVTIPTSIIMEASSLCIILLLLCGLLAAARFLLRLLPQYPWLLSAGACAAYWLGTSGLVFSIQHRVPVFAVDPQTLQKIFIAPASRSQYLLEGLLLSACAVAFGASAAFIVFLPSSFFPRAEEGGRHVNAQPAELGRKLRKEPPRLLVCRDDGSLRRKDEQQHVSGPQLASGGDLPGRSLIGGSDGASREEDKVISRKERRGKPNGGGDPVGASRVEDSAGEEQQEAELLEWIREEEENSVWWCGDRATGGQLVWANRLCMLASLVMSAFILVSSASIMFQAYRQKSLWYKPSFFPVPTQKRGPMRVDRGNSL